MTNAQILSMSINEWIKPIITTGVNNFVGKNQFTAILGHLISPDLLLQSVENHLSLPLISQYIEKLPDDTIPGFSMEVIDGMIATRAEQGPLPIPMLGVQLTPDAFRNLKSICEQNFKEYAQSAEATTPATIEEISTKTTKTTKKIDE